MPHKEFDGFIKGKGALYQNFWTARQEDMQGLSPEEVKALVDYFSEQVFGITMDDDEQEYERQKVFNEAKRRELAARKEHRRGGSRDQNNHEAESGGESKDEDDRQNDG